MAVKYNSTEAARAAKRRYKKTIHGKAKIREWELSIAGRVYNSTRYSRTPQTKTAHYLRNRLKKALRRNQATGSTLTLLGCSVIEFIRYCETHSNWQADWVWSDLGTKFHLDHIKALGLFDLLEQDQLAVAAHWSNIQPLSTHEHSLKTKEDTRLIRWFQKGCS
jgi:hypothetical protein